MATPAVLGRVELQHATPTRGPPRCVFRSCRPSPGVPDQPAPLPPRAADDLRRIDEAQRDQQPG